MNKTDAERNLSDDASMADSSVTRDDMMSVDLLCESHKITPLRGRQSRHRTAEQEENTEISENNRRDIGL